MLRAYYGGPKSKSAPSFGPFFIPAGTLAVFIFRCMHDRNFRKQFISNNIGSRPLIQDLIGRSTTAKQCLNLAL
jgi:hypothetical protein